MKIEARGLTAGYGANVVIRDLMLGVAGGQLLTIVGPNGSGKSTLLKVLGRLLKPMTGTVCLDGQELNSIPPRELAKRMAVLAQINSAPEDVTVEELVEYGRYPHRRLFRGLGDHDHEAVERALRLTRMEFMRERQLVTLSGGERQRAWIAMTLAQEPELLLLDEPTTFLDICCQFEVMELIRNLKESCGMTVIMVLHDLNMAARCSDRLVMMKEHEIRYSGPPDELMTPEILRDVFEIESEIIKGGDGVPYFIASGSARRKQE